MRIIHTKWFPPGNFAAINICGLVFAKTQLNKALKNHEYIHTLQQREMLYVFFFTAYLLEWAVRYLVVHNAQKAYYAISFEREAYANQHDLKYHHHRPRWAWIHYVSRHNTA